MDNCKMTHFLRPILLVLTVPAILLSCVLAAEVLQEADSAQLARLAVR